MQIDLVGKFSGSIYPYVLTGIVAFTKYLFVVHLTSPNAAAVAKALVSTLVFFQQSYILETFLTDRATSFVADLIYELSRSLDIKLIHASLKHQQTVGVVERVHDSFKRIIKIHTYETWSNWHRYSNLATFTHNTSHISSIGTTPSLIFH